MRCLVWVVVCALVAAVPAVGLGEKPLLPPPPIIGGPGPGPGFHPPVPGDAHYKAPKADGKVVELLDEGLDTLFPILVNDRGGQAGTDDRGDRELVRGRHAGCP